MQVFDVIVRFFQEGGSFMFPIAVVLAMGVAIAIERYFFLSSAKRTNKRAFAELEPLLHQQKYDQIRRMGEQDSAPISRVIGAGIARLQVSPRREDIEYAMEEGLMETIPRLEKRTPYLGTLANISTLLGLLGTIIGLIAAFSAVANADPSEKASLLSQSISVAMNTTAFGLIAAIPLLGFHSVLQTKTTEIVDSMEMAGVKCLNALMAKSSVAPRSRQSDE
ncbi:MotA/TolQ/ExbB proton channel family protein [Alteromonas sp. McT4-15]|jgi:biopolymer transport protein ExbB/TolQ|uniref:MotA/TolQ/ExbB proton channel family protein n=1 Tax=unclassified Alteromonas TaxID=2614992 RepID=UPI0019242D62|nr:MULTISPECIES: MotA/TolQ/ExbB proton channel family protein [unclassified Alteromonas]MCB4434849.1 MotA/TolQ/ExbB proton channel family protein [Alteromonas sp. McT4-15]WDT85889.1 MotA/TolQ/ExbB proton channel family protein [Alteromonas sp. 009811495]BCO20838.1 flagellar motor protein MotA [Alteromonas sp. KC3]BCO24808.1 flagellar motor protein MotA [Alteromonas sp. KC14]|tara:strand:+ start:235 stop:900 length:666 start_codon:yes stop_codon:yes gene_type:complete